MDSVTMNVIFESSDGTEFKLALWFNDTVLEMKKKIQLYTGIPIFKQNLIFNNHIMKDDLDTKFYQVLPGSRLQLQIIDDDNKLPLLPDQPNQDQDQDHHLDDHLESMIREIEETSSSSSFVSVENIKIQVVLNVPQLNIQFRLEMGLTNTIDHLKQTTLQVLKCIPECRFAAIDKLVFRGEELGNDNLTLMECGFFLFSDDHVFVMIKPSPPSPPEKCKISIKLVLTVPLLETQFSLDMNIFNTVGEVKQMIQQARFGIRKSRIVLLFCNEELVEDNRTLYEYDFRLIRHEVTLLIRSSPDPFNLLLYLPNIQFLVEMDLRDTVGRLKQKILEFKNSSVSITGLNFRGRELDDDNRCLSYYGMIPATAAANNQCHEVIVSVQHLPKRRIRKKLKLFVSLLGHGTKKIKVEVKPLDNVGELRKELERLKQEGVQFDLPTGKYYFLYNSARMDEGRSFEWHGVKQGGSIKIFSVGCSSS